MIKFEYAEVVGIEAAIRGMRNPMNSWDRSDSYETVGPNDRDLMRKLCAAGPVHRKFMRMINVYVDITAPLYWWKEFDTYKVGTVCNSCSTMHKITEKEFTLDDFSHEHLNEESIEVLEDVFNMLNKWRAYYLAEKDSEKKKQYWYQLIQLLPSSYNQRRTVMMSYEVLANIYQADCRRNHKLDEWKEHSALKSREIAPGVIFDTINTDFASGFCDWIKSLPYSELITLYSQRDKVQARAEKKDPDWKTGETDRVSSDWNYA